MVWGNLFGISVFGEKIKSGPGDLVGNYKLSGALESMSRKCFYMLILVSVLPLHNANCELIVITSMQL